MSPSAFDQRLSEKFGNDPAMHRDFSAAIAMDGPKKSSTGN